jgi:hypothetical protein
MTGGHNAPQAIRQSICTKILQGQVVIGCRGEKLANAASYVKVIVKQSLGMLKTPMVRTEHVRTAHTSMALAWASLGRSEVQALIQRQEMSVKRRDTTLPTNGLYSTLPISFAYLSSTRNGPTKHYFTQ